MGLEGAVAREVREETGINVSAVHYHYGELDDARWFARDWLSSRTSTMTLSGCRAWIRPPAV